MRRRIFDIWMMINRPPCAEDFGSASNPLEASICSCHGYLHPEFLAPGSWLLTPSLRQPCGLSTRRAARAAAVRVSTPSLAKRLLACFFTVLTEDSRMIAISGFVLPSAIQ